MKIGNWNLHIRSAFKLQMRSASQRYKIELNKISTGRGRAGIFVYTAYGMFGLCLRHDFRTTCSFNVSVSGGVSGNVFAFLLSISKRPYNLRF